LKLLISYKY